MGLGALELRVPEGLGVRLRWSLTGRSGGHLAQLFDSQRRRARLSVLPAVQRDERNPEQLCELLLR
ncbi:MAG: hypothetical protein P8Y25_13875 [Chromatiaceae bacterium]